MNTEFLGYRPHRSTAKLILSSDLFEKFHFGSPDCPKQVGLPSEQKKSPPTMNVGEWFLWPELRQSSPTRKAKPSYKSPVSSINCCSIFRGWSSEHWSKKTTRNGVPKGLVAGHSWSRCYSANSPTPIPCARFATAWAVVWANWFISA